jgi:hypothetical protein
MYAPHGLSSSSRKPRHGHKCGLRVQRAKQEWQPCYTITFQGFANIESGIFLLAKASHRPTFRLKTQRHEQIGALQEQCIVLSLQSHLDKSICFTSTPVMGTIYFVEWVVCNSPITCLFGVLCSPSSGLLRFLTGESVKISVFLWVTENKTNSDLNKVRVWSFSKSEWLLCSEYHWRPGSVLLLSYPYRVFFTHSGCLLSTISVQVVEWGEER